MRLEHSPSLHQISPLSLPKGQSKSCPLGYFFINVDSSQPLSTPNPQVQARKAEPGWLGSCCQHLEAYTWQREGIHQGHWEGGSNTGVLVPVPETVGQMSMCVLCVYMKVHSFGERPYFASAVSKSSGKLGKRGGQCKRGNPSGASHSHMQPPPLRSEPGTQGPVLAVNHLSVSLSSL